MIKNPSNDTNRTISDDDYNDNTVRDGNLPLSDTIDDYSGDLDFPIPRPSRKQANGAFTSIILQMIRILGLNETMSLLYNQSSNGLIAHLHDLLDAFPTQEFASPSTVTQPEPPTNYFPLNSATLAMHQAQFGQSANAYPHANIILYEASDSESESESEQSPTLSQRNYQ